MSGVNNNIECIDNTGVVLKSKRQIASLKYYQRNKAAIIARAVAYHKEHKDTHIKAVRDYYNTNKDNENSRVRLWRVENKDKIAEYNKNYYQQHKNIARVMS